MKSKPPKKPLNKYAQYSGMAFQMIAIIGVGTYIGIMLDEKYPNEKNLFTLISTLSSVIISIFVVIHQILSSSKDK